MTPPWFRRPVHLNSYTVRPIEGKLSTMYSVAPALLGGHGLALRCHWLGRFYAHASTKDEDRFP